MAAKFAFEGLLNGVEVALREPTMNDLPELEAALMERGESLQTLNRVPQSEVMLLLFAQLCVKYGDQQGISREELGSLPPRCANEIAEAVTFFRHELGL